MNEVPKRKRINDKTVRRDARKPYCEVCGKATQEGEGAHHVISKGSGGADHPWNLVMLCNPNCHIHKAHGGHYSKRFLFEVIAKREGVSVDEVEEVVWELKV